MIFNNHITVLLQETVDFLNVKSDGTYVDCTLGRCGHSKLILSKLSSKGKLICFDQDQEAIDYAIDYFKENENVIIIKSNFKNLKQELNKNGINKVDGFVFDLGLSSPQLDNPERGFSYNNDAQLDMRMDRDQKLNAHYIVNNYSFERLCSIFRKYGEIKQPQIIANAIVKERQIKLIDTTAQLVEIIKKYSPIKLLYDKKHPARLYFQAIRIEVNDEINILEKSFEDAISLLNPNGVICIISFHSLEDNIVKKTFSKYTKNKLPREIPLNNFLQQFSLVTKKIIPSQEELERNNRARSSILRAMTKNY